MPAFQMKQGLLLMDSDADVLRETIRFYYDQYGGAAAVTSAA